MADYWRDLGVPDCIRSVSASKAVERPNTDWYSMLGGGGQRPGLTLESPMAAPEFKRTWDSHSLIALSSCLSVNRGLYISYFSPVSRNIQTNLHIFHHGKPLHKISHIRLGTGRQSPQFGVYVFFPNITHERRTTTYLTMEERRVWIDRILLPAARHCCPADIIQHHPRSFEDAKSKACSRRRETCSGLVQNDIDMHHFLPEETLEPIWNHAIHSTAGDDMTQFRDMFIVLNAKNIKLEAKSATFQGCRDNTLNHLQQILNGQGGHLELLDRHWHRRYSQCGRQDISPKAHVFGALGRKHEIRSKLPETPH